MDTERREDVSNMKRILKRGITGQARADMVKLFMALYDLIAVNGAYYGCVNWLGLERILEHWLAKKTMIDTLTII